MMIMWKKAINQIWSLNRVHVSEETTKAYRILKKIYAGVKILKFNTGKSYQGWSVPKSWDVVHAFLKDPKGKKIADFKKDKLILWTNSISFKGKTTLEKLKKKILFNKENPNAVMFHFRNQYTHEKKEWGFSLPYNLVKKLKKGNYQVDIKTKFTKGNLEMAEDFIKGKNKESLLFVGHFDHPQQTIDGLSSCIAIHEAFRQLKKKKTKLSYVGLSTIEIIGSVFYSKYFLKKRNIKQAIFMAGAGLKKPYIYQNSFKKNSFIDRITKHILKFYLYGENAKIYDFRKGQFGNDEISFDVGGINVSCGSLMTELFKEYHTNFDTPKLIDNSKFQERIQIIKDLIFICENNFLIKRKFKGLPRLSAPKYKLYMSPDDVSGMENKKIFEFGKDNLLNNLSPQIIKYLNKNNDKLNYLMNSIPNLAEGNKTIFEIAEFVELPFNFVLNYLKLWEQKKLITMTWKNPLR